MSLVDYRCRECGYELEADYRVYGQVIDNAEHLTPSSEEEAVCLGRLDRVWSAPHMGAMSSGEPPR